MSIHAFLRVFNTNTVNPDRVPMEQRSAHEPCDPLDKCAGLSRLKDYPSSLSKQGHRRFMRSQGVRQKPKTRSLCTPDGEILEVKGLTVLDSQKYNRDFGKNGTYSVPHYNTDILGLLAEMSLTFKFPF
ncbi:hypothetical protein CIHG_06861 [Coccidioides immitis H538.4]|uniref:Uncharacterized protein n=3 Tax=Coccidioides immitis TaxID=5501 RepID=A0A0J8QX70_COCIT|nr:hypothetical protein CIRG_04414 [Coccidioides immitis RMSCC 2394]KMU77499.1 hypothetical protein CISG_06501 [Coccidioides immitis RMSCC 3703]KMU89059.1 hypothetical protein CIHG_06861 [Coccidioides immitis H538.4]